MIDFVYPPRCASCDAQGTSFCSKCSDKVSLVKDSFCSICGRIPVKTSICDQCRASLPAYSSARSWAVYAEPLRHALLALKYHSNLSLGNIFAEKLSEIVIQNQWQPEIIIPIPLSKSHLRTRGYNQAQQIAYPLSLLLNIPLETRGIKRVKETASQVKLDRIERFKNLEDAFLGIPAKLKSKKVLLVDDIVTTGATLNSCSKAILAAGGSTVYCITVAQTL
jgi:ComF family protein